MLTDHPSLMKLTRIFCVLSCAGYLVGCDSDAPVADTSAIVTVTPSANEGVAPFSVTFDVDASNTRLFSGAWDFGDGARGQTLESSSITHTFFEPGTYTTTVNFDADRISVEATEFMVELTVISDPDLLPDPDLGVDPGESNVNLIVSSFAIDTEVTPGGVETVSAIIQNIGEGTLGGDAGGGFITVGYYLSTDNVITIDDIYVGDTGILIGTHFTSSDVPFGAESLSPGENYQYDHQLFVKDNVPTGTYFAGAIVDYIDEYHWYDFPRSTDTQEFAFPVHIVVPETDEEDNTRLLPAHQVSVTNALCADDAFEHDDSSEFATPIAVGVTQLHNFCFDNADWLQFNAVQGSVYKITTSGLGLEADTQLILYDRDAESILLFHDNFGNGPTVDLTGAGADDATSEIVWETEVTGTYFIKVRTATCDEDLAPHCRPDPISPLITGNPPDGVGLLTEYSITLQ